MFSGFTPNTSAACSSGALRQGVAAHHEAEQVGQAEAAQQFGGPGFAFVGYHGQRDAEGFQELEAGLHFGVDVGVAVEVFGIMLGEHGEGALPHFVGGLAVRVGGKGAVHEFAHAVAHIGHHQFFVEQG